jgi:hypothetical protein
MHICHIVLNNIGGAPKVADSLISSQSQSWLPSIYCGAYRFRATMDSIF